MPVWLGLMCPSHCCNLFFLALQSRSLPKLSYLKDRRKLPVGFRSFLSLGVAQLIERLNALYGGFRARLIFV